MRFKNRFALTAVALCTLAAGTITAGPAMASADYVAGADYAAGKYHYQCIGADGRVWSVGPRKSVAATCKGANAVSQYLDSGQHVWTHALTPSGKLATFKGGADCYIAVGGAAFAALTFEDTWVWYVGTGFAAAGLHSCAG
ncbi:MULTISPECIES: hypothetical protein [Curtobacterium]|uniref:hypothetical protein n=1 Tax=Curtobacterium TaxID=2034 RepID=UPI00112E4E3C|nr:MULTISPECIES: hypothetical protein [Curtobacterium]MCS6577455.1 hypothetical protein [Curtobacterium flaccumfaciens]MDD1385464.1 hypothetical protein [Curtobacterium flaccumfaciens pv. poinsettiae]MDQ0541038.1 hypothetical protein [Curtobacterium flaccumfaciens]UXZ58026.1 hypothetical protein MXD64_01195 [Curtobacterium sp. Arg-1]